MQQSTPSTPTLYARIHRAARAHGGNAACFAGERRLTYAELVRAVAQTAAGLRSECGAGVGAPVAVMAGNSIEWLIASLAIQRLGAVEVPQAPELDPAALVALLEKTACVAVFTDSQALVQALGSAPGPSDLRRVIWVGAESRVPDQARVTTLERLRDSGQGAADSQTETDRRVDPDTPAAIIRTSGTTGEPKTVLLSQGNLGHGMTHLPRMLRLGPRDVVLLCLPLWHLYGRLIAYLALTSGAQLHMGDINRFEAELRRVRPTFLPAFPIVWEQIYRQFADVMNASGPLPALLRFGVKGSRHYYACLDRLRGEQVLLRKSLLRRIVQSVSDFTKVVLGLAPHYLNILVCRLLFHRHLGGRLRAAVVGDAPLPRVVDEGLRAMGFHVFEGYGSTEQIVSAMRTPRHNTPGTIGRPLPQVDIRIVDAEGVAAARGESGEINVGGPQVCLGYVGDTGRNASAFYRMDGRRFHRTGDLGMVDLHGNLIFVGRTANLLWPDSDWPVSPELTENEVLNSRLIERAVVYPFGLSGLGILVVPDFRQLCRRLGAPPGVPAAELPSTPAPAAWADFVDEHEAAFRTWLGEPRLIGLFRRALNAALAVSTLSDQQLPSRFRLLWRPLRIDDELTPTLKLKRRRIHARLQDWGEEHLVNPAAYQAHGADVRAGGRTRPTAV